MPVPTRITIPCCIALLLGSTFTAAQNAPESPSTSVNSTLSSSQESTDSRRISGFDSHTLPGEIEEENSIVLPRYPLGPTPVADVRFLMDDLGVASLFGDSGIRTFGWLETGYTYSSAGSGLLSVQTRLNRFADELNVNQLALVLQKPLKQDQYDWGFLVRYYSGADAANAQPLGGLDYPPSNPRFSQDFRDLYLHFHLPVLTEGGVNVRVGRMNTIIGFNGYLAPYRPMYSSDYQFAYSQDGAFTGAMAQVVVNDQLNFWNGFNLGANTFFRMRGDDTICYIGQVNYWLTPEQKTQLTASVTTGPQVLFAPPEREGAYTTMADFRVIHNWSEYFTQAVQSNMGWVAGTPFGSGSWYGLYTVGILHLASEWDLIGRVEWFRDINGARTGIDAHYGEITFGVNWHPSRLIEFRPEIRGDFADRPAFGGGGIPVDRNQLTLAMSALIKF
jgi:hypothetical protein